MAELSKTGEPKRRGVVNNHRRDVGKHGISNTNIRHDDISAQLSPGIKKMTGLSTKERNGERAARCHAQKFTVLSTDTAWHVHSDTRNCSTIDLIDHRSGSPQV
jgi:hypothetical protein